MVNMNREKKHFFFFGRLRLYFLYRYLYSLNLQDCKNVNKRMLSKNCSFAGRVQCSEVYFILFLFSTEVNGYIKFENVSFAGQQPH